MTVALIDEADLTKEEKTKEETILLGLARNLGIVLSPEKLAFLLSTKGAVSILRRVESEDRTALKVLLGPESEIAHFLHLHHPQTESVA